MAMEPFFGWLDFGYFLTSPVMWLFGAFVLWMLVDAVRRQEWLWVLFIVLFPMLNAILYYFLVVRASPSATSGFELPGAHDRKLIKDLEAKIHHLDKAHHHLQLGDIYFQQGKLEKAEACYRASLALDAADLDAVAHLGQCLLRRQRPAEARPCLEQVCAEDPKHDYGHTHMALAETLTALGERAPAIAAWRQVLEQHSYARARVQLAELLLAQGDSAEAQAMVREVVSDDAHAPAFQRERERPWVSRAKKLVR